MISHSADVPRLVERWSVPGWCSAGRTRPTAGAPWCSLTPEGEALEARLAPIHSDLCREVAGVLEDWESKALLGLLQQLRDGIGARLGFK